MTVDRTEPDNDAGRNFQPVSGWRFVPGKYPVPESEKAVERRESKKIELTFLRRCATLSKDCEKQNSVEKQGWRE